MESSIVRKGSGLVLGAALLLSACAPAAAPPASGGQPAGGQPAAGQSAAKPAAAAMNFRWAVNNGQNTGKGRQEQELADAIKKKTDGKVNVEIFWEGALGAERTAIEGVGNKSVEMGVASSSNFSSIVKAWTALDLPFMLVGGYEGLTKLLPSPAMKDLEEASEKAGFKIVGYCFDGFRHLFTTKKEVKTPADLKGVKLRTTPSPIEAAYVSAFGGNPTVVDWGETYLALKQGTVDGYFVAYSSVVQFKMNDAIKYANELSVVPIISPVAMNLEYFNSLPADVQKAILDAGKETAPLNLKRDQTDNEAFKKTLLDEGVKVTIPTKDDVKPWKDLSPQVYDKFQDVASKEWIAKVDASQK
ncbi:MAG: TRAP transporter substrate-binding protein [Solirubrobacterales bacterium]